MWTAPLLIGFYKLMYPFIWFLNGAANQLLRVFGIQPATEHEAAHTEEEIRILMEESHKSGYIEKTELALVDNIFDFAERNAREIMIPRTDMVCLYANLSYEENLKILFRAYCKKRTDRYGVYYDVIEDRAISPHEPRLGIVFKLYGPQSTSGPEVNLAQELTVLLENKDMRGGPKWQAQRWEQLYDKPTVSWWQTCLKWFRAP